MLHALDGEALELWQVQARALDKLYAPTRYPDALGDEAPMDVFGPEDVDAAVAAAEPLLRWVARTLNPKGG